MSEESREELVEPAKHLDGFWIVLVAITAVLIVLANGMLCVFLVKDSRLWQLVRIYQLRQKLCCL